MHPLKEAILSHFDFYTRHLEAPLRTLPLMMVVGALRGQSGEAPGIGGIG